MGKWILAVVLLSGCVISPSSIRGSDGSVIWGGNEAVAAAVTIAVFGTAEEPRPYCSDPDPGPPHTCPSTVPKTP